MRSSARDAGFRARSGSLVPLSRQGDVHFSRADDKSGRSAGFRNQARARTRRSLSHPARRSGLLPAARRAACSAAGPVPALGRQHRRWRAARSTILRRASAHRRRARRLLVEAATTTAAARGRRCARRRLRAPAGCRPPCQRPVIVPGQDRLAPQPLWGPALWVRPVGAAAAGRVRTGGLLVFTIEQGHVDAARGVS